MSNAPSARSAPLLLAVAAAALSAPGPLSAEDRPAREAHHPRSAGVQSVPAAEGGASCPDTLPVLVSRPLAEDAGLAAGDRIRLSARPDTTGCGGRVAGVYELPADPYRLTEERPRVLLHLPHLADLAGREGQVDRFTVALRRGASPERVGAVLEALLPGTRVLRTEVAAARTSTTFRVVERFHRAIGVITIAAGGVFLACIMVLKVQERRREVAALRLVGVSRRTLLGWIVAESAVVAVVGGALGVGVGRVASWAVNAHYRGVYDTRVAFSTLTAETVGIGLVLAVALGLLAGGVAAARLLWIDPLEEVGG